PQSACGESYSKLVRCPISGAMAGDGALVSLHGATGQRTNNCILCAPAARFQREVGGYCPIAGHLPLCLPSLPSATITHEPPYIPLRAVSSRVGGLCQIVQGGEEPRRLSAEQPIGRQGPDGAHGR